MSEIKAIQTTDRGYLTRAILEARKAILFNCCGVEYD